MSQEVLARWRRRREEWTRLGVQVDGAKVAEEVLADLEALLAAARDVPLTLQEAARESGYSADHLGRLVRQGKIPNAGRPSAPRIRRRDLPRRARAAVADVARAAYDAGADARKLVSRRKGGTHGLA
jgi:hypothetical protein